MSWEDLFTWVRSAWPDAEIKADISGRVDVLHCGDPDAEYAALTRTAGLLVSPLWAPIVVEGQDAADYLHRRLSQSIIDQPVGLGRPALQLDGDGRMQAELLVYRAEGAFFLLSPRDAASQTVQVLEQFVFMDDLNVHRQWEAEGVIALAGPMAPVILSSLMGVASPRSSAEEAWRAREAATLNDLPCRVFGDGRWSVPFYHICVPLTALQPLVAMLSEALRLVGGRNAGLWAGELLRLESGLPRFGDDTTVSTLPLDADLQSAINFDKGCYPGQEVIARFTNLGHPARRLVRLEIKGEVALKSGAAITLEGHPVGVVTSAQTWPGLGRTAALGYLKWKDRQLPEVEIELEPEGEKVSARVVSLEDSQKGQAHS